MPQTATVVEKRVGVWAYGRPDHAHTPIRPHGLMIPPMPDASSLARYARQTAFAPLGEAGQRRWLAAGVAIIGCGATGSAMAALLARAGVGRLRVIDRDFVEWNN